MTRPYLLGVLLAPLVACSEYGLNGAKPSGAGEGGPDIEVYPESVDVGPYCGTRDQPVTISNVGDETLELVEVSLSGDDWAISSGPALTSLEPDEDTTVILEGRDGLGTLSVRSNDADEGEVTVPLSMDGDMAPSVSITSPSNGDIEDIGVAGTFTALVADDLDSPDALALSWASDVDGVFGTSAADADGNASAGWDSAAHTPGDHVITLTATDSCGNSVSEELGICQQAGYTSDELDIGSWHTEGGSLWDEVNDWLQLTDTSGYLTGSAFATAETVSGADVDIEFGFYVGGGTGADGFTLTALDTSRMTTWLGSPGCGLGYAGPSAAICVSPTTDGLPGWTVEVDTYYNAEVDPTDLDHVCFTFDGNLTSMAACAALPEMEDTGWHTMSVSVGEPHVLVAIDGVPYIDQDISGYYDFPAYVGFTAATGGSTNYHLIRSLQVTDYVCE